MGAGAVGGRDPTAEWRPAQAGDAQNVPFGAQQWAQFYDYVLSEEYCKSENTIAPFRVDRARLQRWATREEEHAIDDNWQQLTNDAPGIVNWQQLGNDTPGPGASCPYTARRLAHLAVKWTVTSSFDAAERIEQEPVRFVDSVLFSGKCEDWGKYIVDNHVCPSLQVVTLVKHDTTQRQLHARTHEQTN